MSRRRGPGGDPEVRGGSLQRRLHPPVGVPSIRHQDGPLSGTKGSKRRAPGDSVLEPAGHFCVLEPFTPPGGLLVFPAALGGDSASMLGLNLQLQLYFRRQTFVVGSKDAVAISVQKRATDYCFKTHFLIFSALKVKFSSSPEQGRQRDLTITPKPHEYKSINHTEVYLQC